MNKRTVIITGVLVIGAGVAFVALRGYPLTGSTQGSMGAASKVSLSMNEPASAAHCPIEFRISTQRQAAVSLLICDPNGGPVRTLVDTDMAAGQHAVVWDGMDDRGHRVAGDAYLAVLHADARVVNQPIRLRR